jgi:hypothetical protein
MNSPTQAPLLLPPRISFAAALFARAVGDVPSGSDLDSLRDPNTQVQRTASSDLEVSAERYTTPSEKYSRFTRGHQCQLIDGNH